MGKGKEGEKKEERAWRGGKRRGEVKEREGKKWIGIV